MDKTELKKLFHSGSSQNIHLDNSYHNSKKKFEKSDKMNKVTARFSQKDTLHHKEEPDTKQYATFSKENETSKERYMKKIDSIN